MEQIQFTAGSPYPHACFNARASRLGPVRVSLTGWSKTLDFQQLRKAEKLASKQTDVKQKGQDTSRWSEWTCCAKMKLAINVDYTKGPCRPQTEILWGVRARWGRMWTLSYGSLTPKLVLTPASKAELFVWCPWGFVRCWHSSSRIWVLRVCGSEGWSTNRGSIWVNSLLEILWIIFLRSWRNNDCIRGG